MRKINIQDNLDIVIKIFKKGIDKGLFRDAYDYILEMLNDIFGIKKVKAEPCEITMYHFYEYLLEAKRRDCFCSYMKIVETANIRICNYYNNEPLSFHYDFKEKIISEKSRSAEVANDMTETLMQRLAEANRLSGRRMEIISEIEPDLYKVNNHLEEFIENNYGGVTVIDLSEKFGYEPVDYGMTCKYIAKLVKKYRNARENVENIRKNELFLITKDDISMLEECLKNDREIGTARKELDEMVGLSSVKTVINKAIAGFKLKKVCMDKGIRKGNLSLHMVFTGNPGTAKTTVARLFAEIMKDEKILPSGNFVEAGRADLVGDNVGAAAPLVKKKFKEAQGGVLFIDEAYSLCDSYENDFGDEAEMNLAERVAQLDESKITPKLIRTIEERDIPEPDAKKLHKKKSIGFCVA